MAEYQIKLSGWQAAVGAVILLIIVGVRLASFNDQKDNTALMEKLKLELTTEYFPDDVERLRAALESGDRKMSEEVAGSITSTKLNIQAVQTSYPLFQFISSKDVVVKVSYSIEDDNGVRERGIKYYLFRHGAIGDSWQYRHESSAISYYLNFI